jgi:hypothetical protein
MKVLSTHHVVFKGRHGQLKIFFSISIYISTIMHTYDTAEHPLIVSIEQPTKAGKAGNSKDLQVPEKSQGPNLAGQGLTAGIRRRFEFGGRG